MMINQLNPVNTEDIDHITMAVDHRGMVVEGVVVDHKDMVQKEVDRKMLQKKQLAIVANLH